MSALLRGSQMLARSFGASRLMASTAKPTSKHPVIEEDGVYMRQVDGKYVQTNKDGVICAEMQTSLEWCLSSPPPFHTFAEQPIVKEPPSTK